MGLFCISPKVIVEGFAETGVVGQEFSTPTSIFWAVLKHCGENRDFWEAA